MSSDDSDFSESLTPIDDPSEDSVIWVDALRKQEESDGEQQGKRHAAINVLSDDDLREVFYHHCVWLCHRSVRCRPWWQPLVHVCRRWRRIVFASPNYLGLKLVCDNMTPTRDSLDIWPPLPIVMSYEPGYVNGDQNVIAALEHQDRITKIIFRKTSHDLLERLCPFMQASLPALTELDLRGESTPVLPEAFLGGSAPDLRSCTLRGIGFPGLPKLLASTSQLVSLLLHDIPYSGYIPPDVMGSCLATLPNLDRLIIKSSASRRITSPPPPTRDILPSLTHFDFTGSAEYLEDLVARIDAPCLYHLVVTFPVDFNFIASQLVLFISRTERIKELHRNNRAVELDPWSVSMADKSGCHLEFRIGFNGFSWRFLSLEELCHNLSPLLSQVGSLRIRRDSRFRSQPAAEMDPIRWLDVFLSFSAVTSLYISARMAPVVVGALGGLARDNHEEVLPKLDWMGFNSLLSRDKKVLDVFISDRRRYANRKIAVMVRR